MLCFRPFWLKSTDTGLSRQRSQLPSSMRWYQLCQTSTTWICSGSGSFSTRTSCRLSTSSTRSGKSCLTTPMIRSPRGKKRCVLFWIVSLCSRADPTGPVSLDKRNVGRCSPQARSEWWKIFERLQLTLRDAATKKLSPSEAHKYLRSGMFPSNESIMLKECVRTTDSSFSSGLVLF